jgi:hypothetical protein
MSPHEVTTQKTNTDIFTATRTSNLILFTDLLVANKLGCTSQKVSGVPQSVQCLVMDWMTGVRSLTEAEDFSSNLCIQTGSGAHPASCTMGTGGFSPG